MEYFEVIEIMGRQSLGTSPTCLTLLAFSALALAFIGNPTGLFVQDAFGIFLKQFLPKLIGFLAFL